MNTCFRGPPLNLTVQCFLWYAMVGVATLSQFLLYLKIPFFNIQLLISMFLFAK